MATAPPPQQNRNPEALPPAAEKGGKCAPRKDLPSFPDRRVWLAVVVNWLVPGSGYFLVGQKARGWALVVLLNGMFLLGLGLKGAVIVPEFNFRSQSFNVINVLTFGVQMGAGVPSLASMGAHGLKEKGAPLGPLGYFAGEESAAVHDLGSFHLLLVGALNYFACCTLYDKFRRRPTPKPES